MRRLSLVLAVIAAAVASSGCERLCAPNGIGVFCPEGPDNRLNERPSAGFELSYPPAGEEAEPERLPRGDTVETGRDVIVRSVARDPDGDDLFRSGTSTATGASNGRATNRRWAAWTRCFARAAAAA
jgi:hypothetical protein